MGWRQPGGDHAHSPPRPVPRRLRGRQAGWHDLRAPGSDLGPNAQEGSSASQWAQAASDGRLPSFHYLEGSHERGTTNNFHSPGRVAARLKRLR